MLARGQALLAILAFLRRHAWAQFMPAGHSGSSYANTKVHSVPPQLTTTARVHSCNFRLEQKAKGIHLRSCCNELNKSLSIVLSVEEKLTTGRSPKPRFLAVKAGPVPRLRAGSPCTCWQAPPGQPFWPPPRLQALLSVTGVLAAGQSLPCRACSEGHEGVRVAGAPLLSEQMVCT